MSMNCYFSSMTKKWVIIPLVLVCVMCLSISSRADEAAERILRGARYAAALQNQDLHGHIRKDGKKTPVSLFLRGKNIQFQYLLGKAYKIFHMQLEKDQFGLYDLVNGKRKKFNTKMLSQKINGTDLTFEDLSMSFLYWKQSSVEGEERVNGQKSYKIRLINPDKDGDYRIVYAWVHVKHGALVRVMGFDAAGKALKKFEVIDIMKVGKEYTLKRMRVDTQKGGKVLGTTYLEFDKPKKPAENKGR